MTNRAAASAPVSAVSAAVYLDEMMARVGVDGLAAAFAAPGLLATLDQHAAAVREAVLGAGRMLDADGLAAYARSIAAAAVRAGRPLPAPGAAPTTVAGWSAAAWPMVRMVAVCLIAESAGLL
ncbi:hypothetical protein ACWT_5187 [Actinoplanes sp. SE50]|uniref:DUF6401 family natural product biosynthesis protein n=1 Tax=unclassified Actinoplanes TaxID=2626549 RepID=UPI00023ED65E|nr:MULTISPECIES: DUF6401 family natural product biosynthesis protein [unclassified Actinoplanes]AEV86204.1 hypothetical protein ACPL_5317 [Actinoplanes sp. SE50/110]ATO84602.1 hypothetical protein ACWT_5187 [Actinoplanes sp. SE50]SLM02012.1 hypothetical protein ACSP50_5250 [Actinoplanes sp. SE50/110]